MRRGIGAGFTWVRISDPLPARHTESSLSRMLAHSAKQASGNSGGDLSRSVLELLVSLRGKCPFLKGKFPHCLTLDLNCGGSCAG